MDSINVRPGKTNGVNAFRPGKVFKNGRLLIFERYSLTVMNPWPNPLAWRRTTRRPFQSIRPELWLIPQSAADADDAITIREHGAVRNFMEPVPADLQALIGTFEERQWHMMALFARCPGADDLARSTPALAFALASNWIFLAQKPTHPMRSARRWVRKPQIEICDWLGFPNRKATVSLLRKLSARDVSAKSLLDLRCAMQDKSTTKILSHLPRISPLLLALTAYPHRRDYFSPNLLKETLNFEQESEEIRSSIFSLLAQIDSKTLPPRKFHSLRQIHKYAKNQLEQEWQEKLCPKGVALPTPPFESTPSIVPLRNSTDLFEESLLMGHCVANYFPFIMKGGLAVYRVLGPERATIALVRDGMKWRIGQIASVCNKEVLPQTVSAVQEWLFRAIES